MAQFKPLKIDDTDKIIELMVQFYSIDNYPIDVEITRKNFEYFIENQHAGAAFLIVYDNDIVGYLIICKMFSFEFGGYVAFLDELYIDEKMRGKGIGREAVLFVQNYAKEANLKAVLLEVEPHNITARQLYKKMNFKNHHRRLMAYKPSIQ